MANMSYCRFRNTSGDLNECLEALDPYENEHEISDEEIHAGIRMFVNFLGFCRENGIIDGYDGERVAEFFKEANEAIRENNAE